jgi:hypothetical protein
MYVVLYTHTKMLHTYLFIYLYQPTVHDIFIIVHFTLIRRQLS